MNAIPFSPEMLQRLLHQTRVTPPNQSVAIQARVLTDLLPHVHRTNPFKVGDLVAQAPEFACYSSPSIGNIAIVTDVLPIPPAINFNRSCIYERNDIVVLVYAGEPNPCWYEFAAESWRFKKYEGEVA